jgi:hypothetical protein
MDKTKKELQAAYKERQVLGGVYALKNTGSGKRLIDATVDLQGIKNRFEFMKKTGSCMNLKLQQDWTSKDPPFVLEVVEELEKGQTQTQEEYLADLDTLKEMWLEKLAAADLYN